MTRASESLVNSKAEPVGDDISAFGHYIEQEMRRMRNEGLERGISMAKLRIQQIMFEVQNEQIPIQQQGISGLQNRAFCVAPQQQQQQLRQQQQPVQVQSFWPSPQNTVRYPASDYGHSPLAHSSQEGRWYQDLAYTTL